MKKIIHNTINCLLIFVFSFACKSKNLFIKFEAQNSLIEEGIADLQANNPSKAYEMTWALIPEEIRNRFELAPTAAEKARIIVVYFSQFEHGMQLILLYNRAALEMANIKILEIMLSVADIKQGSSIDFFKFLMSVMPRDQKSVEILATAIEISSLMSKLDSADVPVGLLIHDTLLVFLGVISRLSSFDKNADGQFQISEIEAITDSEAQNCIDLLQYSQNNLTLVLSKKDDKMYASMLAKIKDLRSKIENAIGESASERFKNFVVTEFSKNKDLQNLNINDAMKMKVYRSIPGEARIAPVNFVLNSVKEAKLRQKYEFYKQTNIKLLGKRAEPFKGWLLDASCDSLLFSSLYAIGINDKNQKYIKITKAKDSDGLWQRNPTKDCLKNDGVPGKDGASTSISRDMLTGLALWLWFADQKQEVKNIIDYGHKHSDETGLWIMGYGKNSKVVYDSTRMSRDLQDTYELLNEKLSGHSLDHNTQVEWVETYDFASHLQVLSIFLRGLILKGIASDEKNLLDFYDKRSEGKNALYKFLNVLYNGGDMNSVVDLLLDEKFFPEDQTPSSTNYCTHYLWQRDYKSKDGTINPDWLPCPPDKEAKKYDGVDFLFVSSLLFNKEIWE